MPSISVLDKSVYELIAAGEVIEKPASVIKEVIENSIDAGAKHITVEIKRGGIEFMRVADDGCGIAREDVPVAFLRHATSKISVKNDLDNIMTLGFRGEALASVAAVAKVSLLTKRREDEIGTSYAINGSVEEYIDNAGCPDGTTIIIKDLFYNVPARKKFLKKEVTEANAISFIVRKVTLSHPEISFKLIRDNRMEFCSSGDGNLKSAIYAVYGKDFTNDMIPVNYEMDSVRISGYVIKPLYSKSNRSFQNFFVDKRYVSSKLCSSALENAYENLVMVGKFPACVLDIVMPPDMLDVNIHPTKAQVRFSDEKKIADALYFAVKNALMKNELLYDFKLPEPVPSRQWKENAVGKNTDFETIKLSEQENQKPKENITLNILDKTEKSDTDADDCVVEIKRPEIKPQPIQQEIKQEDYIYQPIEEKTKEPSTSFVYNAETGKIEQKSEETISDIHDFEDKKTEVVEESISANETPDISENIETSSDEDYIAEEKIEPAFEETKSQVVEEHKQPEKEKNIIVIGEIFKNYILAQADEHLVIIDKHAAHERVLFEKLKRGVGKLDQQYLMTPAEILLTSEEFDALAENSSQLIDSGFIFSFEQKPIVKLLAVPSFMSELDFDEIISEIANNVIMHKQNPQTHYFDDMLHTMACKAAIKANDNNLTVELQYLADEIFADNKIRHCPHGRPVMFRISKYELEKQFKRTGV